MGEPSKQLSPEDLTGMASLKNWGDPPDTARTTAGKEAVVDCGWGRLIFGQTFDSAAAVARTLKQEGQGSRDIAIYVREPHVLLAAAPQALFLDPSHTFRLSLAEAFPGVAEGAGFVIRPAEEVDEARINAIYMLHGMVPLRQGYCAQAGHPAAVDILVAEDSETHDIAGVVMGVDHHAAFADADNGASLWALAVDSNARAPGIGAALVLGLADRFRDRGRSFMDLSVLHTNEQAIALYQKLGFVQVPVYSIKKKNPINEKLFIGPGPDQQLNIYASIIVNEARRRGIGVTIEDAEAGLFTLTSGGRSVACRESLSELTSAVAMSRCDDKTLTHRLLKRAGLAVPGQRLVAEEGEALDALAEWGRVVVKPARGEQGHGVFVDLATAETVRRAVAQIRAMGERVIVEQFVEGEDLRIIVIDGAVVAAATRRAPSIVGDGEHSVTELIEKLSRRRAAATGGESRIPLDAETERCVAKAGHGLADVPREGEQVMVRRTANLHTGGTIHDVTDELHLGLADAAVRAAEVLHMPVVGLDFIVPSVHGPAYHIIEANERPGLANHEPQPTAERFIDFLFPLTRAGGWSQGAKG